MSDPKTVRDFAPSGFFAFRTPLLPFEELEAWGEGLEAPGAASDPERLEAALAADRAVLRSRLKALLERPEIREALFLASPSLFDGLDAWLKDPDGKKGGRAERALVRYLLRMAARATPFGLFSGCSLGELDAETRLALAPRAEYQRHTRLDMDYLFALAEDLGRDPEVRRELVYRPNSSLYRAAGRLRYAEARLDGKVRSHHLVALEATEYLEDTLRRAASGARAADLVAALVASDPDGEITEEDAGEFVAELIESQVLVSDLALPVTGPEAIHGLIAQLEELPPARVAGERLAAANAVLAELDAGGPGASPDRYRAVAEELRTLPTSVELSRLFQVDMVKPGDRLRLGEAVVAELVRAVELLYSLAGRQRQDGFESFRREFSERYGEGRWVPLVEALDEEVGIGFERSGGAGAEASPLLKGMAFAPPGPEPTIPWAGPQGSLFRRLEEALARGEQEIALGPRDLERLRVEGDPLPLPDAFQVIATVAAASHEDLDQGRFSVLFRGAGGPSGARLLGRFCHADPELSRSVEEHLRAEEALRPEAVYAEIVHLPQGRIGNILSRPVLRRHEIPYLGRSGAAPEDQIPVTDLEVTVSGPRIGLRSRRLGREVVPRLTSAHNYARGSLGVYRFLCALQSQGVLQGVSWSWGALDAAAFLPRVTSGRLILARARWRMAEEEIKPLARATGPARFSAVQAWREGKRLPRLITLADGDNELLVDLDNPLAIDTFLDLVEERNGAILYEFFPGPDELCARGPEGRFVHELVLPFARVPKEAAVQRGERAAGAAGAPAVRRSFPPGSEWLYAKLYTGSSTADGVLREVVAPVVAQALGTGAADSWFFIRYGDPEWHLRLRLHGEPRALLTGVLPVLQETVQPFLDDGRLWRVQLDTYEREVERYGGPSGIELAERLFDADSRAALAIVETLEGDEGADARWRLALRGTDMLLGDLGLDAAGKLAVLAGVRDTFSREFGGGKGLRVQLDQKFRAERKGVEQLLDPALDEESDLAPGFAALKRRSERIAPIVAELSRLQAEGRLTSPLAALAPSFVHMHVNRMIRSAARAHELVLYDLLYRVYESRAARERGRAGKAGV